MTTSVASAARAQPCSASRRRTAGCSEEVRSGGLGAVALETALVQGVRPRMRIRAEKNYTSGWSALGVVGVLLHGGALLHCAPRGSSTASARAPSAPIVAAARPGADRAVSERSVENVAGEAAGARLLDAAAEAGGSVHWLGARRELKATLRGDWDISSALLVVYNRNWQAPIQRLLAYAHDDLPVYVLATPHDARSHAFR